MVTTSVRVQGETEAAARRPPGSDRPGQRAAPRRRCRGADNHFLATSSCAARTITAPSSIAWKCNVLRAATVPRPRPPLVATTEVTVRPAQCRGSARAAQRVERQEALSAGSVLYDIDDDPPPGVNAAPTPSARPRRRRILRPSIGMGSRACCASPNDGPRFAAHGGDREQRAAPPLRDGRSARQSAASSIPVRWSGSTMRSPGALSPCARSSPRAALLAASRVPLAAPTRAGPSAARHACTRSRGRSAARDGRVGLVVTPASVATVLATVTAAAQAARHGQPCEAERAWSRPPFDGRRAADIRIDPDGRIETALAASISKQPGSQPVHWSKAGRHPLRNVERAAELTRGIGQRSDARAVSASAAI
jgi:hypothetical protein